MTASNIFMESQPGKETRKHILTNVRHVYTTEDFVNAELSDVMDGSASVVAVCDDGVWVWEANNSGYWALLCQKEYPVDEEE